MPVGSLPGERRGGRKKGTVNKRTQIAADASKRLANVLGYVPERNARAQLEHVADTEQLALVDATDGAVSLGSAMQMVDLHPFTGNALQYLQSIYRDPRLPRVVRMDAAKSVIRYETPALANTTITADADTMAAWRVADTRKAIEQHVCTVLMRIGIVTAPRVTDVADQDQSDG